VTGRPRTPGTLEERVQAAIRHAQENSTPVTVASIAAAAKASRASLYRHPSLLAAIQDAQGPGLASEDKRSTPAGNSRTYGVTLSANEVALVDECRRGGYRAPWLRQAVLEKLSRDTGIPLDALDGAAPRRAPGRPRTGNDEKGQEQ